MTYDKHIKAKPSQSHLNKPTPIEMDKEWMAYASEEGHMLDTLDQASLDALILHLAFVTNQNTFSIERTIANHFNLPNVKVMPSTLYNHAVAYILKLMPTQQAPLSKAA